MTDPQQPSPYGPPAGRQPSPPPEYAPPAGPPVQPNPSAQANPHGQHNPYAQPNPQGQPILYGAAQPYGFAAPRPRTNPLAIVSICASGSIVVLFVIVLVLPAFGLLPGAAGVVTGHIALSQIKRTGEQGRALAIAGLAIGYATVGLLALGFVGMLVLWFGFLGTGALGGLS